MPNAHPLGLLRRLTHVRPADAPTDGRLLARYLARRDGAAFAALVERHGPMVLGVCRRVLGRGPDAEDAFQATFLVLVRRAASVVPRERVGRWLYGVACRTAMQARAADARRRRLERAVAVARSEAPPAEAAPTDWRPLLDEELLRLPERYRSAIRACDLEGRPRKEAARLLGWPEGTLSGRLARGRRLLASRLARRGVTLAGVLAAELARESAAGVPPGLTAAVLRTAAADGGAVPPAVAALTEGVVRAMRTTKLKLAAAVILAVGVCVVGSGVGSRPAPATEPPAAKERPPEVPRPPADDRQAILGDWRDDAGNHWLITPDEITVRVLGNENLFTYQLGPTGKPRTIDLTPKPPTGAPPAPGIYRFEGGDLILCVALGAWKNRRPTEFTSNYRSQCVRLHSLAPVPLVNRDDRSMAPRPMPSRAEENIEAKLRSRVSLDFRNKPLIHLLDELHAMTGLNIIPDTAALNEAGISFVTPVSLKLTDIPLRTALRLALSGCGLTYVVTDGAILVTTPEKARGRQTQKVYDVSDLVPADQPGEADKALVKLITQSVCPQTWAEVGGAGTAGYYPPAKCLIVNQTPDVQEQIEGLLSSVRELNRSREKK